MVSDENRMLLTELTNLKKRGTPDTDPRVKAIHRMLERQKVGLPREGIDFPAQIKFVPNKRQNGLS
jgi:hypothetical protein